MNYKFKVGDRVKVSDTGSGFGISELGLIFTISELGEYCDDETPGYRVYPIGGNGHGGYSNGFNGEGSFELVKPKSGWKDV